jgi:hypothetical protein
MAPHDAPDVTLGRSWEELPYLDRIWRLPQLPWEARTLLLEMHQAGILEHDDLSLATLSSLASCGLGRGAMEQVLSRFWHLASAAQRSAGSATGAAQHARLQRSPAWKNATLLGLLREGQVRRRWPVVSVDQLTNEDSAVEQWKLGSGSRGLCGSCDLHSVHCRRNLGRHNHHWHATGHAAAHQLTACPASQPSSHEADSPDC